ncbi:MAG TPA: alpha/beta hydrolase-fold protein [Solirubrobacteraceae bacterium]|nr:alpha/beta hydrolase-fold protein [Solirubrobacteraceae bacterium]
MSTPAGPCAPEILEERWDSERVGRLRVRSPALGRAAWVHVILPAAAQLRGPDREGAAAPLLLLLHGADGAPEEWERRAGIVRRCEQLEALVLMPEGGPVGFCTDWLMPERSRPDRAGSPGSRRRPPAWERFHLEEVLGLARRRFGAGEPRVVLGVSMGGHGALAYSARHPGTFVAAASFSGVLDSLDRGIPSLIASALLREGQHRHAIWGSPLLARRRWRAHNPIDLAERLNGTALYLARGDGRPAPEDPEMPALAGALERLIGPSTSAMAARLAALGIPAVLSQARGVHEWPTWNREFDRVWPFLCRHLGLAAGGCGAHPDQVAR